MPRTCTSKTHRSGPYIGIDPGTRNLAICFWWPCCSEARFELVEVGRHNDFTNMGLSVRHNVFDPFYTLFVSSPCIVIELQKRKNMLMVQAALQALCGATAHVVSAVRLKNRLGTRCKKDHTKNKNAAIDWVASHFPSVTLPGRRHDAADALMLAHYGFVAL